MRRRPSLDRPTLSGATIRIPECRRAPAAVKPGGSVALRRPDQLGEHAPGRLADGVDQADAGADAEPELGARREVRTELALERRADRGAVLERSCTEQLGADQDTVVEQPGAERDLV